MLRIKIMGLALVAVAVGPVGVATAVPNLTIASPLNGSMSNHSGSSSSAPSITLTFPANGGSTSSESQLVSGSAGTAAGDLPTVTVRLFAGSALGTQAPLESITVQASNGSWSATFGGLSVGTYTVRAEQSDEAAKTGVSAAVTFTVTAPAAPVVPPPTAGFIWLPSNPKTGESVLLGSTSSDDASPITALAWDINGVFNAGAPVLATSFPDPGSYVVKLRVTAADGLSRVAAETINVTGRPAALMQPFPIVRIVGTDTGAGVKLRLLTVQAPAGALITVRCKGRSCPGGSESRVAASGERSVAPVQFRRFERFLQAGVILEIRVSAPGEIGEYTRIVIRRGKLPERVDRCLSTKGITPIPCPSS